MYVFTLHIQNKFTYTNKTDNRFSFYIFLFISIFLYFAVPPQPPKIFNERKEHIQSRAGPYEEGSDLQLHCVVVGGLYII